MDNKNVNLNEFEIHLIISSLCLIVAYTDDEYLCGCYRDLITKLQEI